MLKSKTLRSISLVRDAEGNWVGVTWLGMDERAQLELAFWYLSGRGDGCYTRELWR